MTWIKIGEDTYRKTSHVVEAEITKAEIEANLAASKRFIETIKMIDLEKIEDPELLSLAKRANDDKYGQLAAANKDIERFEEILSEINEIK
jgi:hypothetical protein